MHRSILLGVLVLLVAGPALAAPPEPGATPVAAYRSERFALSVRAPAGWSKEFEGAKASGTWIDLVSFREAKTRALLKVSAQASTYAEFGELEKKLTAYYRSLSGIVILRGPEALPAVMGLRGPGLYVEFARTTGRRTDRSFLAYYLNGRFTVRVYGTVNDKGHRKVASGLEDFLRNLRFFARSGGDRVNFHHEAGRCALLFPEGWTVRLPAKGPIAIFRGEEAGASIWLYREEWPRDLRAYRKRRLQDLRDAGAKGPRAEEPEAHAKRGEEVLTINYQQGDGEKTKRYREVCLKGGDAVYRIVLGASEASFPRGEPALEKMVETFRVR